MRAWLVCLAALWVLPVSARPFKELCAIFEPLMKLSGLKYVHPSMKVKSKDPKVLVQSIFFTIEAKAGTIRVPVAADGSIAFPATGPLCAENPNVECSQPPGSMEMTVSVEVSAPPSQVLEYRVFTDMKAADPVIALSEMPRKVSLAFK